jgi:hypothetical protein
MKGLIDFIKTVFGLIVAIVLVVCGWKGLYR